MNIRQDTVLLGTGEGGHADRNEGARFVAVAPLLAQPAAALFASLGT